MNTHTHTHVSSELDLCEVDVWCGLRVLCFFGMCWSVFRDGIGHTLMWINPLASRLIHPEGLPSDYTITMLFRLLPETPKEPFALWEILNSNNEPLVGVILDSEWHHHHHQVFVCACLGDVSTPHLISQMRGRLWPSSTQTITVISRRWRLRGQKFRNSFTAVFIRSELTHSFLSIRERLWNSWRWNFIFYDHIMWL